LINKIAVLGRFIGTWYVSTVLLIAVGLAIGSSVFLYAYPGKPEIAVIDIPFTVINDRATFEIGAMFDYVRDDGSIKGVVISLNSPGGGAAPSEELYFRPSGFERRNPLS
jgi:ClpP class serine protease